MKNARIARLEHPRRCIRHLLIKLGEDEPAEGLKDSGNKYGSYPAFDRNIIQFKTERSQDWISVLTSLSSDVVSTDKIVLCYNLKNFEYNFISLLEESKIGYELVVSRVVSHSCLEILFLEETYSWKPDDILRNGSKNGNNKQCCK